MATALQEKAESCGALSTTAIGEHAVFPGISRKTKLSERMSSGKMCGLPCRKEFYLYVVAVGRIRGNVKILFLSHVTASSTNS